MSKECIPLFPSINTMTEILFVDSHGELPKLKEFNQSSELGGFAIGAFKFADGSLGGTGFIFNVCSGVSQVKAYILTAAHVFIDNFEYKPMPTDFLIGSDIYEALPLKNSIDWGNSALHYYDPITNFPISIPEDWVICELKQKLGYVYFSKLISLKLSDPSQPILPQQKTKLVGIPKQFIDNELQYFSPESDSSQCSKVRQCLLGCNKLIVSKGKVLSGLDMICTTSAGASGMSGCPLLINDNGQYNVIGILHGGPASPIHYYISQLIFTPLDFSQLIFDNLIDYISLKKKSVTNDQDQIYLEVWINVLITIKQATLKSREIPRNGCFFLQKLYSEALYIEFATGNKLKYNLCVPLNKFYYELARIINLI